MKHGKVEKEGGVHKYTRVKESLVNEETSLRGMQAAKRAVIYHFHFFSFLEFLWRVFVLVVSLTCVTYA